MNEELSLIRNNFGDKMKTLFERIAILLLAIAFLWLLNKHFIFEREVYEYISTLQDTDIEVLKTQNAIIKYVIK